MKYCLLAETHPFKAKEWSKLDPKLILYREINLLQGAGFT